MLNDLRQALRLLAKHSGFSVVAIITLALGVGANTAIFSVIESVILNPLPYPGGDRVVHVWSSSPTSRLFLTPSVKQFEAFRSARSFDAIEAYSTADRTLTGSGDPELVSVASVGPGMVSFVGSAPTIGRGITSSDTAQGAAVALISEPLWKRRYGGDQKAIGTPVTLNDSDVTIVGVFPASLRLPAGPRVDFITPLPEGAALEQMINLSVVARLRTGVSIQQAEAELNGLAGSIPRSTGDGLFTAKLMRPQDHVGTAFVQSVRVLFAAVACLLLIACANVTNLVLARNAGREREIAVRRALGARPWTLARQLLVENIVLAVAGGAGAVLVAMWAIELIANLRPVSLAQLEDVSVSPLALGFNLLVSVASGVLFGIVPALRATRVDIQGVLKGPAHGVASGGGREWFRRSLLVAEIALALVLLTAAGLLARSFARLQSTPLGFDSSNVVAMQLRLPPSKYPEREARAAFYRDLLVRMRSVPGVEHATLAVGVPPRSGVMFGDVWIDGRRLEKNEQPGLMAANYVGPAFFDMLRIRVVEGRPFTADDVATGPRTVIVNRSTARRFWPGRSAVGGQFGIGGAGGKVQWSTVVGVVDDVKANGIADDTGSTQLYLAFGQQSFGSATVLVRPAGNAMAIVPALKAAVWAADANLPIRDVALASDRITEALSPQRFNLVLLGIFAALGVVLAVVGVYGVMMYFAAQREHEMGVRLALGATPSDMIRMVLRQAGVVTGAGLAIGVVASWSLARFMKTLLYEIGPNDPVTFAATIVLLACAAFAGSAIPAWRITRVDPTRALRAG